ncbi:NAD(P)/FAD-dependent oxidoreductase, partial [Pseudomonas aeruginosa]
VPGIAPAAKQQGKYVANLIGRRLKGKPADGPFKYRHQGNLATIGRSLAVIDMGRVKLRGAFAWWIWKLAHIYFLIGTRNRLSVALSWVWNHSIGYRGSRIIMHAIADKEPTALDKSGSLD